MSRLVAVMRLDVRLQHRNKLYAIGVGVAVLLGLMVRSAVPEAYVGRTLAAFYLLFLGGTTFMFGASMLLLEKGERTLDALRATRMTTRDYVASKVVTLTAFAVVESAIVYALASRGVPTMALPLLCGGLVLGAFYTLLGLGMAAAYDAVTSFLLPWGAVVASILQLPFLSLLDLGPWWLWYLIPSHAALLCFQGAFEPLEAWQWAYVVVVSCGMLGGGWWFCLHRFRTWIRFAEAG